MIIVLTLSVATISINSGAQELSEDPTVSSARYFPGTADNSSEPYLSGGSHHLIQTKDRRPGISGSSNPIRAKQLPSPVTNIQYPNQLGSSYIPMDSWIYPALDRLSAFGFIDTAFLGLRPWTAGSIINMLQDSSNKLQTTGNDEALEIYQAVQRAVSGLVFDGHFRIGVQSVYARYLNISGARPLTSSFEFGQTLINDSGRPYSRGSNSIAGFIGVAQKGRVTLQVQGEYQHAPGFPPLPNAVQKIIANRNAGPGFDVLTEAQQFGIGTRDVFRLLQANLSYHVLGHEISIGKSEMWLGPNQGGAFLWSTNAEPIYTFRINRVEPLYIPYFSRIFGTIRYDNYFGALKGHVSPNRPWIFGNKISIHPTKDIELGFSRSCEFAGRDYSPLTFGTFWKCFSSSGDFPQAGQRRYDVGDRRGSFDFRWRLPFAGHALTLYTDSLADDDPSPLANPGRAGWAPGIYISHLPKLSKFDFRFEAPYTNAPAYAGGAYTNHGYRDGFTNKGQIIGYWVGRNSAAYQSWLTYWINPKDKIQAEYRDAKLDRSLWQRGGTQTDITVRMNRTFKNHVEIGGFIQSERYFIPALNSEPQHNISTSISVTWNPMIDLHK